MYSLASLYRTCHFYRTKVKTALMNEFAAVTMDCKDVFALSECWRSAGRTLCAWFPAERRSWRELESPVCLTKLVFIVFVASATCATEYSPNILCLQLNHLPIIFLLPPPKILTISCILESLSWRVLRWRVQITYKTDIPADVRPAAMSRWVEK